MKWFWLNLVFISFFFINIENNGVLCQARLSCMTPIGVPGLCTSLQYCPEVLTLFRQLSPSNAAQYSFALRRVCNNQITANNYPLVCCQSPVLQDTSDTAKHSQRQFTTQPPTVIPPTKEPIDTNTVKTTDIKIQSQASGTCRTPSNEVGKCLQLRNCNSVRDRLLANPLDEDLKQQVRDLNKICNSVEYEVCCANATVKNTVKVQIPTEETGCGLANQKIQKIYGGEEAAIGSWPWMALLGYDKWSYNPFRCGGSLISKKHVITAAHCTKPTAPTFIRLGEHDLSIENETIYLDIDISRIVSHPDFGIDGRHDIALIFLETLVDFTENISPICLPMAEMIRRKSYVNSNPFVAGWGRTDGGGTSHVLLQTQLPILENSICHNIYNRLNRLRSTEQFDESVICAGVLSGGIDTCQGDSGGPLMVPEVYKGSRRYYLLGIVSYGIKCAEPGKPGVYTNVRHFLDWITDNLAES